MDDKKKLTLDNLKNMLNASATDTSKGSATLQEALKLFIDSTNDFLSMKVEYQNILDKYLSNGSGSDTGNSYNLPGVFATSMANYDVNAAQADNDRISELIKLIEESESQKNYYYDAVVSSFNDIVNSLQKMKKYEQSITEYLIILQQKKDLK